MNDPQDLAGNPAGKLGHLASAEPGFQSTRH